MTEVIRDSDGTVIEPSLHDSKLIRIDFGRQQLSMYFQCVGEIFFRLVVRNIVLMLGAHLAEENIVLDVVVTEGLDVSDDALSSILPAKTEAQLRHVTAIRRRLSDGSLRLLEISPSYGGEITIICESVEYEEVTRPISI
ncbi:hypothetical protein [Massilia endophytica]|uniref:hypothetical protein n=1 Tax=Massilia endophytica TaxID=2899220 RepID=UPI001E373C0C|nr:hypothetical protein [Massilia endophytica]UGQ48736.1 hypothetical protein LSQ66_09825 [Massilia endophytica]